MAEMNIRRAEKEDVYRLSEIIIWNYRMKFYPIFRDDEFYFKELQVKSMGDSYLCPEKLENTFVYDDGILKGVIVLEGDEVKKLFVDPYFQNGKIGTELLQFAVRERGVSHLWALEKNTDAIRFYARHGFLPDGRKKYEEDTVEYLVHLTKQ